MKNIVIYCSFLIIEIILIVNCSDQNDYGLGENVYENRTPSMIEKITTIKRLLAELNREDKNFALNSSKKFWIAGEIDNFQNPADSVQSKTEESNAERCCKPKPASCSDIQEIFNYTTNGIYTIYPKRNPLKSIHVYCDLETDGGEWTVIQRRNEYGTPRENFTRGWLDYKLGFGNLTQEFWLGNDIINVLTSQENVVLRIDMETFESEKRYAEYDSFRMRREQQKYQLNIAGFRGDAGDSLLGHNNAPFTTIDSDNDSSGENCAKVYKGAWWYTSCHSSNLNGFYYLGKHDSYADGVDWSAWKGHHYSLKKVEMKIRPI